MKKSTIIVPLIDLLGAIWLLGFVASTRALAIAEERDFYDFGDSADFLVMIAPVLVLCFVVNVVWTGSTLVALARRRGVRSAIVCAIVLALWPAVFAATKVLASLPVNLAAHLQNPPHRDLGFSIVSAANRTRATTSHSPRSASRRAIVTKELHGADVELRFLSAEWLKDASCVSFEAVSPFGPCAVVREGQLSGKASAPS